MRHCQHDLNCTPRFKTLGAIQLAGSHPTTRLGLPVKMATATILAPAPCNAVAPWRSLNACLGARFTRSLDNGYAGRCRISRVTVIVCCCTAPHAPRQSGMLLLFPWPRIARHRHEQRCMPCVRKDQSPINLNRLSGCVNQKVMATIRSQYSSTSYSRSPYNVAIVGTLGLCLLSPF